MIPLQRPGSPYPAFAYCLFRAAAWAVALGLAAGGAGRVAADPAPAPTPAPAASPAPASGSAPAPTPAPSESPETGEGAAVMLDPFEVQADADNSYGALNSRAVTAFNVQLDSLPVSADIFDQAFMNDVAATTVEDMIETYSAGAGYSGIDTQGSAASAQPGDRNGSSYVLMRGVPTTMEQRDGLLFIGTFGNPGSTGIGSTSNFDVERVELINGPQALLYVGGGGGGVINVVSKEARIDQPAFGSYEFRTNQFGEKYGQFDYGVSKGRFAVRVALVNAINDTRRVNLGDQLNGAYIQLAARFGNTTFRASVEQTVDWKVNSADPGLVTTGDPALKQFNGYDTGFLLATGQAGGLLDGELNWNDKDSFEGVWAADEVVSENVTFRADSQWTDWLSSQVTAGAFNFHDDHVMDSQSMDVWSPGASANPIPGNWTVGMTGSDPAGDAIRPYRGKAGRVLILATNKLFGGRATSQTMATADYVGSRGAIQHYDYYEADSNWNVIEDPSLSGADALGRVKLSKLNWTVNSGPVLYPWFNPLAPRITIGGVNYVRELTNPYNTALVSPSDPLGESINGGENEQMNDDVNRGYALVNYTEWLDNKLDTLAGVRFERAYTYTAELGSHPPAPPPAADPIQSSGSGSADYNLGADYHLLPWLAPYASLSCSYSLPPVLMTDPNGNNLPPSRALGEEVGVKLDARDNRLSGSIALYHTSVTNEELQLTTSELDDIAPTGLNGQSPAQNSFPDDVTTEGAQVTISALPVKSWRMRLSLAYTSSVYDSSAVYNQQYNDQFYENAAGDVTYADGTVVYVPATYNSKELTVPSTTAGAVPLTVNLISNPSSSYFANPTAVNGAINSGSPAAKVLEVVDPTHGAILTGAVGLPMSDYQLNTTLTGITPPGVIAAALAGQETIGHAEFAANYTTAYDFSSGFLKGTRIGGSYIGSWENLGRYYFPDGYHGVLQQEVLFKKPTVARFDLIAGYGRKAGKLTWRTQLNATNVFNHYHILLFPNYLNGFQTPADLSANFDQQPRAYVWTNTISF